MDYVKCQFCPWTGPLESTETHFYGLNEIPICPACGREVEDVEFEENNSEIPF